MSLRIALPPLDSLTPDTELAFAHLDRTGRVSHTGVSTLAILGQAAQPQAVECFLHPADSVLTHLQLPPLSAAKIQAAVRCAAQALILGRSEQMHVTHSPRDADGRVFLSWLPTVVLQRLGEMLSQHRLKLRGLYPAPYGLPVPAAGHINACVLEGYLLLRHGPDQGAVEPQVQANLDALAASGSRLAWFGDDAPAAVHELHPAQQRWSASLPAWGLHGGVGKASGPPAGWGGALACCALAIGVWLLGLNLYAARQASEGQQLKLQMSQRVKQAFPELPVILNPLQQARQQVSARQHPVSTDASQRFASLVLHAANAMPSMVGSVQGLIFENGELQLSLPADVPRNSADNAWQAALAQTGLAADATPTGWRLRLAETESREPGSSVVVDDE
ncbi:type II secretion system protein GspL [Pseudomonas sp. S35]|uniref:type II secretion system protein GspL n=1 Tax=Pseudomonas sp. S35 TaxID=1573719 RepID=UPI00132E90D1|nr:type II secretion system protein GspL [Pseudomonas sp. S35]QHF45069.1 type II secretion system protein GspL [Pseudomonas sp. S35]